MNRGFSVLRTVCAAALVCAMLLLPVCAVTVTVREASVSGGIATLSVSVLDGAGEALYAAFYDKDGRMLAAASFPVTPGRSTVTRPADAALASAKVFAVGGGFEPACSASATGFFTGSSVRTLAELKAAIDDPDVASVFIAADMTINEPLAIGKNVTVQNGVTVTVNANVTITGELVNLGAFAGPGLVSAQGIGEVSAEELNDSAWG